MTRALYDKSVGFHHSGWHPRRAAPAPCRQSPARPALQQCKILVPEAGRRKLRIMSALILDGSKIAQQIRGEVAAEVKTMTAARVRPGLAVVLVGHDSASEIYVRGK